MVQCLHVQHLLFAGIVEFDILGSFDVDEHHEDVGKEHVVLLFDLDLLLSKVFSQAVHETFSCVIIILFVTGVMLANWVHVACLDVLNCEQKV